MQAIRAIVKAGLNRRELLKMELVMHISWMQAHGERPRQLPIGARPS